MHGDAGAKLGAGYWLLSRPPDTLCGLILHRAGSLIAIRAGAKESAMPSFSRNAVREVTSVGASNGLPRAAPLCVAAIKVNGHLDLDELQGANDLFDLWGAVQCSLAQPWR